MHHRRFRLSLALLGCLLIGALLALAVLTSRADERSIERSWALAQRSGSYRFSSEIEQTTLPGPSLTNVGQSPQRQHILLEGRVNMQTQLVELRLSQLDRNDEVIELRLERGVATARVGAGAWQPLEALDGNPAMRGDMLAYLAGVQDAALLEGDATGARYGFAFDGRSFAATLREQLERQLREQSKLPSGVTLSLAEQYRALSGSGQITLDADQLPQQLTLNLEQPGPGGARMLSRISTSFSEFDRAALALPWYTQLADQIVGVGWTPAALAPAAAQLLLVLLVALLMLRVARSQSPRTRLAFSLLLLLSMSVGALQPIAQAEAATRITQALSPQPAPAEAPWDPQQDPLAAALSPSPPPTRGEGLGERGGGRVPASAGVAGERAFSVRSTAADTAADPTSDDDNDNLIALHEQRMGTRPDNADSDGDGILDGAEVRGYVDSYGTRWHLNPLDPDMDRDGFPDGAECPALAVPVGVALPASAACHVSNTNTQTGARATNPTRRPDVFNIDSDGDGVSDRDDLSPRTLGHAGSQLSGQVTAFNRAKPLSFNINQIQRSPSGTPYRTYLDLQLRTLAPRNMSMTSAVLDWPTGDANGQIQRMLDSTFAADLSPQQLAADPRAAYGDVRMTPLLEVRLPAGQSSSALPMPLANPQALVQISGDFTATLTLSQNGANIDALFTKPGSGSYTFGIRQGSCLNPEGGDVKSWSGATNSSVSLAASKLLELANGLHHLRVSGPAGAACAPLYDLPNGTSTSKMIDTSALAPYAITVRDLDSAGNVGVFVPVNVVRDSVGDLPVALAARIPYLPNSTLAAGQSLSWGLNHEVRLLWLVQMRADTCDSVPAGLSGSEARAWCWDSANRVEFTTTIQSYYDDWYLTGLNVTEDQGFDLAIAYERPAPESRQNRQVDDRLWALAGGLERTFMTGAFDPATIRQRWDSGVNGAASSTARWNIPQSALGVTLLSYPSEDHLAKVMMEDTPALLNTLFSPYRSDGADAPTLLFARQSRLRGLSLDYLADNDSALSLSNGGLVINLDPSNVRTQTSASLSWSPYRYRGGAWENYPLTEYLDTLGARLRSLGSFNPGLATSELSSLAQDSLVSFARGAYQALAGGIALNVRDGANPISPSMSADDASQALRWAGAIGSLGAVISQLAGDSAAEGFELIQLEANLVGLTPAQFNALSARNKALVVFASMRRGLADVGDMFSSDWLSKKLPGYLHAQPVYSPIMAGAQIAALSDIEKYQRPAIGVIRGALAIRQTHTLYTLIKTYDVARAAMLSKATSTTLLKIGQTSYRIKLASVAADKASLAAAVIGITLKWAMVGVQLGFSAGSMSNYDIARTVVDAVAGTAVALLMLVIALIPGVGQIVAAVVALIDSAAGIICAAAGPSVSETTAGKWLCGGLTGVVTKALSWLILGDPASSDLVGNLESAQRITIGDLQTTPLDPARGIVVGSSIDYRLEFNNRITLGEPNNWMGKAYWWQYTLNNMRDATFVYKLQQWRENLASYAQDGAQLTQWVAQNGGLTLGHSASVSLTLDQSGINVQPVLFLSEGYRIPTQDCISTLAIPICKLTSRSDNRHYQQSLELDVLPASFSEFISLSGAGQGYAPGWCRGFSSKVQCPTQRDADGDGLLSQAYGGADPNDSSWDASGGGLSDQLRLNAGLGASSADSDGDSISDYEELWYGTNPARADSDLDGLRDNEELAGWLFGYDFVNGAALETRVTSDPLQADVDQDGLSDVQERIYGFNPRVPSDSRILSFSSQVRELAAPRALLRFEESAGASGFADSSGYNKPAGCSAPYCPTAGVAGRYGNALQFSGGQGVALPAPIGASGDLSMYLLIRADAGNSGNRMLMYTGHGGSRGFGLFSSSGVINILLGGVAFIPSNVSLTPGQWQAIAAVRSGGVWNLYVNGVQSSLSGTQSPNALLAGDLTLIGGGLTGGESFLGLIDDVALYDRALSTADISTIGGGFFQRNDMVVLPGATLAYQGQITNELFNRYARGLLSTSLPAQVSGAVLPQTFMLSPQQQVSLAGSLQVLANAPSGRINLDQVAGAQITDPQADSQVAELWLRFEEAPGAQRFLDYSGQLPPRDATCSSSCPRLTTGGQESTLFGKWASFNNSDVRASGVNLANTSFTVSMWARRSSLNTNDIIVAQGSGEGNRGLHIGFRDNNQFTCAFWGNDLSAPAYTGLDWQHWACTYDAITRTRRIYRNGVQVATDTASANYSGWGDLVVGSVPFLGGWGFGGELGDLKIYQRALSDQEVAGQLLETQATGTLKARLPFDEPPGASQFRNAGKGQAATCLTTTCPISGLGGRVGQALRFDGSGNGLKLSQLSLANGSFTVAFWAKRATLGTAQAIVSQGTGAASGLYIGFTSDNRLTCNFAGASLVEPVAATNTSTEWTHWTCSFNKEGYNRSIYRNGTIVISGGNASLYTGGGDLVIGRTAWDSSNAYNGLLDDLHIFSQHVFDNNGDTMLKNVVIGAAPQLGLHFDDALGSTSFANMAGGTFSCSNCPLAGQRGQLGLAATFDGVNDQISLGNQLLLKNSFTFSTWIYPQGRPASGTILSQRFTETGGGFPVGPRIWIEANGQLRARRVTTVSGDIEVFGPILPRDRWSHIAVTYENSSKVLRIFLNGSEAASKTYLGTITTSSTPALELGGAVPFSTSGLGPISTHFSGRLDETGIYNRVLSAGEIYEQYRYQVGYVEERQSFPVIVDTNAPTSTLHLAGLSGQYMPNEFRRQLIRTVDRTSSVELAELGVKRHSQSSLSWSQAPRCEDANGGAAWCPAFDPTTLGGEGRYTLSSRSTDVAGNAETASSTATIYVDATPPQVTTVTTGQLSISQHLTRAEAVTVRLTGTASDPALSSGDAGSGIARVSVTLRNPNGSIAGEGTQQATVTGSAWSIDYVFASPSPTGRYRVQAEAEDKVGHTATAAERLVVVDASAPAITLDPLWNSQEWGAYHSRLPASRMIRGIAKDLPRPAGLVHNLEGGRDSGAGWHTEDETCGTNVGCDPNGLYGHAHGYNGANSVLVRDSAAVQLNSFTLAAWIRPSAVAQGNGDVVGKRDGATLNYALRLKPGSTRVEASLMADDCTSSSKVEGLSDLPLNSWTHVLASYDGATLRLYRNGLLEASLDVQLAELCAVGVDARSGDGFVGMVDELLVFDRALLDEDVRGLASPTIGTIASADLAVTPLTGSAFYETPVDAEAAYRLPFDETAAPDNTLTVVDTSGVTAGSCNGDTCPRAGRPGRSAGALSFDRNDQILLNRIVPDSFSNSFSLAVWVQRDAFSPVTGEQSFVSEKGGNGYHNLHMGFNYQDYAFCNVNSTIYAVAANRSLDKDWAHYVCSYTHSPPTARLYRNGVLVASATPFFGSVVSMPPRQGIQLGRTERGYSSFAGALDDLRFYNSALSQAQITALVTRGPLLQVEFEETARATNGTLFADSSNVALNLALSTGTGDTAAKTASGGRGNYAVSLDGVDDSLSTTGINLADRSFTVAIRSRRTRSGVEETLLSQGSGAGNQGLNLTYNVANQLVCGFQGNDLTYTTADTSGEWTHWACSYDTASKRRTLYRNGLQVAQDTASANFVGSGAFRLGRLAWGSRFFKGALDDLRVLDRALSAAEIKEIAAQGWSPASISSFGAVSGLSSWSKAPPAGLEGFYQLDLRATDSIGNLSSGAQGKNVWRGEIDTTAPRIALSASSSGSGQTAQTTYEIKLQDFNLDLARVLLPCPTSALRQRNFSDPWLPAFIGPGTARLYELAGSCSVAGPSGPGLVDTGLFRGGFTPPGGDHTRVVEVVGTKAYVGNGNQLEVYDITNPNAPLFLGEYLGMTFDNPVVRAIAVVGTTAYVATSAGLFSVDVSNPASMQSAGGLQEPGRRDVKALNNIIYTLDSSGSLSMLDGGGPPLGSYSPLNPALKLDVKVNGATTLAYLTTEVGLEIVDVSTPDSPVLVGSLAIAGLSDGSPSGQIVVAGTRAYIATETGMRIVNVTTPASPAAMGFFATPSPARGLALDGTRLYLTGSDGRLSLLDVSNASSPSQIASTTLPGAPAYGVAVISGGPIYVANAGSYTRIVLSGEASACDRFGNCVSANSGASFDFDIAAGPREALVVSPATGTILTSLNPVSVTLSAHADSGIATLALTANGASVASTTPGGSPTDLSWQSLWTPSGAGLHVLRAVITDTTSAVFPSPPVTITVDLAAPTLDFASTTITTSRSLGGLVIIDGSLADESGVASMLLELKQGASSTIVTPTASLASWSAAWPVDDTSGLNGVNVTAVLTATDMAGRVAVITRTLLVDVETPTALGVGVTGNATPLTPGALVAPGTTLTVAWSGVDDGGASVTPSWASGDGLTQTITPTVGASSNPAEPARMTAQLRVRDALGNERVQEVGPFYVDGPRTPDYLALDGADGMYTGWLSQGCSQLGSDRRIARLASGAALSADQRLYARWDTSSISPALRLAWSGADWQRDGDLFVYLDTKPGGARAAYNPYAGDTAQVYMPGITPENVRLASPTAPAASAMLADYAIWVRDPISATLLLWNGSAWVVDGVLEASAYRFTADGAGGRADLLLELDRLGIVTPASNALGLLAFASEDAALRLWAALPASNPLSSARVPSGHAGLVGDGAPFALAQRYQWSSLGNNICPNGSQGATTRYADSELALALSASRPGVRYSYLGDQLTSLWANLLGAQGPDRGALVSRLGTDSAPLADGAVISYTLRYRNEGTHAAQGLVAIVEASHALRLPGGALSQTLNLGTLAPGQELTVSFSAQVDADAARAAAYNPCLIQNPGAPRVCDIYLTLARATVRIYDGSFGQGGQPLERLWIDHAVDDQAPVFFNIVDPEVNIGTGVVTMTGYAYDPSGVSTITLRIRPPRFYIPGVIDTTIVCPDATPFDGKWSCSWDPVALNGGVVPSQDDEYYYMLQVADGLGQQSVFYPSNFRDPLLMDTGAPTMTLNALSSQVVGGDTLEVSGLISDNRQLEGLDVCVGAQCVAAEVVVTLDQVPTLIMTDTQAAPLPISGSLGACPSGVGIERSFVVTQGGGLWNARVGLSLTHPARDELTVSLITRNGQQIVLLTDDGMAGSSASDYHVMLDDSAELGVDAALSDDVISATARLSRPYQPLKRARDEGIQGTWKLRICDNNPSANHGAYLDGTLEMSSWEIMPALAGTWTARVPLQEGQDYVGRTLSVTAYDKAGNRSATLSQLIQVDNVLPLLTKTQVATTATISRSTTVLTGSVSDGSPVEAVLVLVRDPSGTTYADRAPVLGGSWSYALLPRLRGSYEIIVLAGDAAGNVSSSSSVVVQAALDNRRWLPMIRRGA